MSHVFVIQGSVVNPTPEILMVQPFNIIWERDEDVNKVFAKQEFAYAEFMVSMMKSNPYRDYADKRKAELKITAKQQNQSSTCGFGKNIRTRPEGALEYIEKYVRGKSYKEIFGSAEAAEIRKDKMRGSNNPQFGKPAYQGSGNGWSGWDETF